MTGSKKFLLSLLVLVGVLLVYFLYMAWAFPLVRCEAARHLSSPQMEGDCYGCHQKVTAKVAQDWYESKHGVILVRCQTCHGMPDGKGSIPFTHKPGVEVCARCHSLAIKVMAEKFGQKGNCVSCHPHHQNPMHGDVYKYRLPSKQTEL